MQNDLVDYVMTAFMGALVLVMLIGGGAGAVAAWQAYQDSKVCREQTGLYSGCQLKLREETLNLKVKAAE